MSTASQVINHQCASSSLPSHQMSSANSNSIAKKSSSSSSSSVSVIDKSTNSVVNQNAAAATAAESTTMTNSNGCIDPNFEYKGYYKFGRILGKGSFGTVIECVRKCDEKPIALKLFKYNAIHKWIAESVVADDLDSSLLDKSEFFSASVPSLTTQTTTSSNESDERERMLPSEVACLIRASRIDGVVKILDYIPESNLECENAESGCHGGDAVGKTTDQASDVNLDDDDAIIGIVLERDPNEICLFEYLLRNKYLDEDEARVIMKQLIKICINLLHAGVLHGDLKPENILINPRTKRITVIDFGSAQLIDPTNSNGRVSSNHQQNSSHNHHHSNGTTHHSTNGHGHHSSHSQSSHHGTNQIKCKHQSVCPSIAKPFRSFRGTNLYKPPEYILHHCFYPRSSTVWSFGIIVYDMVCGNFPFDKDSDILTHQDKDIEFSRKDLSDSFKDLVRKCLSFYVCDRINIEKILNHPWLNQQD